MTGLSLATISKFHNGRQRPAREPGGDRAGRGRARLPPQRGGARPAAQRTRDGRRAPAVLDNAFHQAVIARGRGGAAGRRHHGDRLVQPHSGRARRRRPHGPHGGRDRRHPLRPRRRGAAHRVPAGYRLVLVDRDAEGITADRVFLDNRRAGLLAARHLMDHGHRHIALVGGEASVSSLAERAEGFQAGLAQRGLDPRPGLVSQGTADGGAGLRGATAALQAEHRPRRCAR